MEPVAAATGPPTRLDKTLAIRIPAIVVAGVAVIIVAVALARAVVIAAVVVVVVAVEEAAVALDQPPPVNLENWKSSTSAKPVELKKQERKENVI